jgi:hypothetical protein
MKFSHRLRLIFALLLLSLLLPKQAVAQTANVEVREIKPTQWEKASKGLDYSKDLPQKPKEQKRRKISGPDWTMNTEGVGRILLILSILIAIVAIGYGIYRMLQVQRNTLIAHDGVEITIDNLDEYIHETDLDRFLREALQNGNYPQAIRLYFLQSIKNLSERKDLNWSREKTNRDYIREMRAHSWGNQFRSITQTYERIWYGNMQLTQSRFEQLQPEFEQFVAMSKPVAPQE